MDKSKKKFSIGLNLLIDILFYVPPIVYGGSV